MAGLPMLIFVCVAAQGQLMISGNETKIDLSSGAAAPVWDAAPDSISILDFSQFPPAVQHISGVPNSVIGPPSNIAITPDEKLALIASSLKLDSATVKGYIPDNVIHAVDLTSKPPRIVGKVTVDQQPSGMSITRDGKRALVANRASGTISLLRIEGKQVRVAQTVKICEPADNVSDVAIHPDGTLAIASVNDAGYLAVLRIEGDQLLLSKRRLSSYGKPYRCVITPDGALAATAGSGQGSPDADAVSVVDLTADPIRTVDHVTIPPGPESIEISPDGKLLAVVCMDGSNLAAGHPLRREQGTLAILARRENTFVKTQELPTGRIPEGVAFSPDGRYLVVQGHPEQKLYMYEVNGETVTDTGHRISVPGFPSSLRIAEKL